MNHLEQLTAEWFEYCGFFVRRSVRVGKLKRGGFAGEVDVVAYHPIQRRIIHVETSMDAMRWVDRKRRYAKKFQIGKRYVPGLFPGSKATDRLDQVVLLGFGGKGGRKRLGGADIVLIGEFLQRILFELRRKSMHSEAVPEQYLLLRTLHFVAQHRNSVRSSLYVLRPNLTVNRTRRHTP